MKKLILPLVAILVATTSYAQIKFEKTIEDASLYDNYREATQDALFDIGGIPILVRENGDDKYLAIYDEDFTLQKTIALYGNYPEFVSKNLFTTDGKICYLTQIDSGEYPNESSTIKIINEDGTEVFSVTLQGLTDGDYSIIFVKNQPKLLIGEWLPSNSTYNPGDISKNKLHIYGLPGTVTKDDVVYAPKSNNVRKFVRNGNIYITDGNRTYNASGTIVR